VDGRFENACFGHVILLSYDFSFKEIHKFADDASGERRYAIQALTVLLRILWSLKWYSKVEISLGGQAPAALGQIDKAQALEFSSQNASDISGGNRLVGAYRRVGCFFWVTVCTLIYNLSGVVWLLSTHPGCFQLSEARNMVVHPRPEKDSCGKISGLIVQVHTQ
jgi:hypothetical protein